MQLFLYSQQRNMLTWCPWVWTSGAKHPNKGDLWQLCCEAGNQGWGRWVLSTEWPRAWARCHDDPPGAAGQISTPTTSPGISSPQASLSEQLHWCLLSVQSMESPPRNYVSYFWVPVPQWYYLPPLKVYPYLDKPIAPGWFTGEGKWGESTYWTSFPRWMGGWMIS